MRKVRKAQSELAVGRRGPGRNSESLEHADPAIGGGTPKKNYFLKSL
jgi:hypothetical protein